MTNLYLAGIDRDGTINFNPNEDFGKESNWREILKLYPGVVEGIKLLNEYGCNLIVCSNQSAVARGIVSYKRVQEVNSAIDTLLLAEDAKIDSWQFCPYYTRTEAKRRELSENNPWVVEDTDPEADLRKPSIGMLRKGAEELGLTLEDFTQIYFIGDMKIDVQTGVNAGGIGILINNGTNNQELQNMVTDSRQLIMPSFYKAAEWIVQDIKSR